MPRLRDILSQILKRKISEIESDNPSDEYPKKPSEKEGFVQPEFPISSEVVIGVEVRLARGKKPESTEKSSFSPDINIRLRTALERVFGQVKVDPDEE